jgi:serine/threonine protein kinase
MIAASDLKARVRGASEPLFCVAEVAPAVKGDDLRADLKADNTQGQAFVRQHMPEFARSFLGTLRQLNERGIVHRDIKLENIMREGTELRLIDWGMVFKVRKVQVGEAPTPQALPTRFMGSPGYIHPNIQKGVGTQNDLHAWGITMLHMLDPGVTGGVIRRLGEDKLKGRAATLADIREDLDTIRNGSKFSKASRDRAREALRGFDDPNSMFNLARQCLEAADTTRPGYSAVEWMNRDYSRAQYDRLLSHPALNAGAQPLNQGVLA